MLNFKLFVNNQDVTDKFYRYSKILGVIFIITGLIGIFYPAITSVTSAIFLGWLMLFSGIVVAFQTWQVNKKDWLGWLKAILFIIVSVLIIFNPLTGIIALGILFTAYFFIDSALNLALALKLRPDNSWLIALLNGLLSFAIGVYFFIAIADPIKTIWLVGIFVGISLFFDGVLLLSLSSATKNINK